MCVARVFGTVASTPSQVRQGVVSVTPGKHRKKRGTMATALSQEGDDGRHGGDGWIDTEQRDTIETSSVLSSCAGKVYRARSLREYRTGYFGDAPLSPHHRSIIGPSSELIEWRGREEGTEALN